MELDFAKICRVCLGDGIMMPIFKVNVSKKLMACASVQVWQNDGLPTQICNKCSAKLHISFQFKKQCEKSDAKLRQALTSTAQPKEPAESQNAQQNQAQHDEIELQAQIPPQNSCVFIECAPLLEMQPDSEPKYEPIFQPQQQQPALTQIYNLPAQNSLQLHPYGINQVQLYNGGAYVTMQGMQPQGILHHQLTQVPQIHTVMQPQAHAAIGEEKAGKDAEKNAKANNEGNKPCTTCGKSFPTLAKLTRHVKTHLARDGPYKCKICLKAFAHSGNYKIHLRIHTDERPFVCMVCDKGCRQAQDLEKHMRVHTGERPHKCALCPRAFSTSSNLVAHVRTHTGERPYVCCVCQKGFCQSNELTKHMRIHTGEKPHICDICHKGFNGSSSLIVHRRSHTGERPYVCKICSKGFTQSSCLRIHLKRHTGLKKFCCATCDKPFVTNADLKEHSLTHLADRTFICNVCGKKYARLSELDRHAKTHEDDTFKDES